MDLKAQPRESRLTCSEFTKTLHSLPPYALIVYYSSLHLETVLGIVYHLILAFFIVERVNLVIVL